MVTTRPPKTIVKPTALGPVANTDTKLLIYGLFQKGRVLAQDDLFTSSMYREAESKPFDRVKTDSCTNALLTWPLHLLAALHPTRLSSSASSRSSPTKGSTRRATGT